MAGKEGPAAAGLMQGLALDAGRLLQREMRVLIEAPPSIDGASVEKVAKQVKAVVDAGRSVVTLEAACLKAASTPPAPSADAFDDSEEMDMDDEPRRSRSPAEVLELRAELERQLERVLGSPDRKSAEGCAGAGRRGGGASPVAVHPARAAAPT